jgi:hypothetical protein
MNCAFILTIWSRVLLGKLTVFQLVKKFPAFYGTQMFITTVTYARHLSLSCVNSIQLCGGIRPRQKWKMHRDKAVRHYTLNQQPPAPENLSRSREIVRDNTEPHQSATNKRKIHTHLRTTEKETGLTTSTLTTYELVQLQAQWYYQNVNQSVCTHTVLHMHCKPKTCRGLTRTSRIDAHNTPNQNLYPYIQKIHLE